MRHHQRPRMKQYWAYYKVYSHSIIQTIQRRLEPLLPDFYEKVPQENYHVTVHPQFQFPEKEKNRFEHYVRKRFPSTIDITLESFCFHPSKSEPRVICLNVDTDDLPFAENQRDLAETFTVSRHGKNIIDPVPPHITVFSVNDSHREFMTLPPTIDEIFATARELEESKLPLSINETDLHLDATQDYPD